MHIIFSLKQYLVVDTHHECHSYTMHRSGGRALQGRHERRELLGHTKSGAAEEVLWGGVIVSDDKSTYFANKKTFHLHIRT